MSEWYCSVPNKRFCAARRPRGNDRIRRFFGSENQDWEQLNHLKVSIERRLEIEREQFKTLADLELFIATRERNSAARRGRCSSSIQNAIWTVCFSVWSAVVHHKLPRVRCAGFFRASSLRLGWKAKLERATLP